MKDKMNDIKLKETLKEYIVSWQKLLLISIILFATDYSLSKPVYVLVLDMGKLGSLLALGMATLFAILPKVTAKLLAKKRYGLSLIALACGLGLLSFIYTGQVEVAQQNAADPLNVFMALDAIAEPESNTHIVATSLIALLYGCAVFLSFLYYSDETTFKPTGYGLSMSSLRRTFQYKILLLKGRFERAFAKPTIAAEALVNEHIQTLKKKTRELQSKLDKQEGELNYELAVLDNAKARIKAAIQNAYKN